MRVSREISAGPYRTLSGIYIVIASKRLTKIHENPYRIGGVCPIRHASDSLKGNLSMSLQNSRIHIVGNI